MKCIFFLFFSSFPFRHLLNAMDSTISIGNRELENAVEAIAAPVERIDYVAGV